MLTENIHGDLVLLSDLEQQRKWWLGEDPHHISSYVELMCSLFDDNRLEEFAGVEAAQEGFSVEFVGALRQLTAMLNGYEEKATSREILEDPEWLRVVEQAKRVLVEWK